MSIGYINDDLPLPLYYQVKCILIKAIQSGEWQLDQQLPTEAHLAKHFGVSNITIRKALSELVDIGLIRREQGRGTFVSKQKLDQGPRELTSFTEEMRKHNLIATSRVLEQSMIDPDSTTAKMLQLPTSEPVFVLKRLRLANGEPMGIQTAHIPMKLLPDVLSEDFENSSLYERLQSRYGLQPGKAREIHSAGLAQPGAAELLGINVGAPVLISERVTFLPEGTPFEFVTSTMRADRYRIVLDLVKRSNTKRWTPIPS